jgi:hypothetical protein
VAVSPNVDGLVHERPVRRLNQRVVVNERVIQ